MKTLTNSYLIGAFICASIVPGAGFAQTGTKTDKNEKTVLKTITIINGDTTISEKIIEGKTSFNEGEKKQIKKMVFISDKKVVNIDSLMKANGIDMAAGKTGKDDSSKTITKRIVIHEDDGKSGQLNMSYVTEDDSATDILIDKNGAEDNVNEYIFNFVSNDGKTNKIIAINSKIIIKDISPELKDKTTSTKNDLKIGQMTFFPNPNKGNFTLEFDSPNNEPVDITITDINGKQVYKETVRGGGRQSKQIDISAESKGVYIIQLQQGEKSSSKKIIIQ